MMPPKSNKRCVSLFAILLMVPLLLLGIPKNSNAAVVTTVSRANCVVSWPKSTWPYYELLNVNESISWSPIGFSYWLRTWSWHLRNGLFTDHWRSLNWQYTWRSRAYDTQDSRYIFWNVLGQHYIWENGFESALPMTSAYGCFAYAPAG